MAAYTYIDRQQPLDEATALLLACRSMAVDTESSGFYTYASDLCLIQISAENKHYLIDVLAGMDMKKLGDVFAAATPEKIFHAAGSDLGELKRTFGWRVQNLFDTMIAAQMLGLESRSLAGLALKYEGVVLEKKEQKSDWRRRPLSKSQLDYAHTDTLYLQSIREKLSVELMQLGLEEEIQQEFEWLTREREKDEEEKPAQTANWTKIQGARELAPRNRGVLAKLCEWRDGVARRENLALFRVTGNDVLLRMAQNLPRNESQVRATRGLPSKYSSQDGAKILKLIAEAQPLQMPYTPRPEFDGPAAALHKDLKSWRQKVAEYRGMDYSLILSNRVLWQIAEKRPADSQSIGQMNLMTDWKVHHYSPGLLAVIRGEKNPVMPGVPVLPTERRRPAGSRPG